MDEVMYDPTKHADKHTHGHSNGIPAQSLKVSVRPGYFTFHLKEGTPTYLKDAPLPSEYAVMICQDSEFGPLSFAGGNHFETRRFRSRLLMSVNNGANSKRPGLQTADTNGFSYREQPRSGNADNSAQINVEPKPDC
jgi:hypothetical protein